MSRERASNDSPLDGPRTYSGTINAHGSGHIFQGNHNVGQFNDMRQFYTGKIPSCDPRPEVKERYRMLTVGAGQNPRTRSKQ
jgi:hypothetical protein